MTDTGATSDRHTGVMNDRYWSYCRGHERQSRYWTSHWRNRYYWSLLLEPQATRTDTGDWSRKQQIQYWRPEPQTTDNTGDWSHERQQILEPQEASDRYRRLEPRTTTTGDDTGAMEPQATTNGATRERQILEPGTTKPIL